MKRIRDFFARLLGRSPQTESVERSISTKNGDDLTDWEKKRLGPFDHPLCPDCVGPLISGPRGGASQNFRCSKCGAKFNLSSWYGSWAFCERISDRKVAESRSFAFLRYSIL